MTAAPLGAPERIREPAGSLGAALAGRDNALNFVRLVLASLVIWSHAWPLGEFGGDPYFGGNSLGGWAVSGFFAISGYLIAGSRSRLRLAPFLWRRALRIFPAFWVALGAVAFVAAPLGSVMEGSRWQLDGAVSYVVRNWFLKMEQWDVPATLVSAGSQSWNGSLWTLVFEFACYCAMALLFTLRPVRRFPLPALALLWLIASVMTWAPARAISVATSLRVGFLVEPFAHAFWLMAFFLAGALVWSIRGGVRLGPWWPLGAAVLLLACIVTETGPTLGSLPTTILVLWAGTAPVRIGSVNDISYGVYIYAFPIQQLLFLSGIAQQVGPWAAGLIAWVLVLPVATLSWHLIEKPALAFKNLVR
ncbi:MULTISPECIES: acyltransferase family protein [unclassified Ornithinimicrobium]|uniref:acyltransferase family protein n=1 Tax=unclassified Ornithinimicrobium TaxID=2615080 RepID=UPI003853AA44